MLADGHTVFVELGPHPVLLPSIQQTAPAESKVVTTIAVARKERSRASTASRALWRVLGDGYPIDWHKVMPGGGRVVDLPLYPWQRERHWVDAAEHVRGRRQDARPLRAGRTTSRSGGSIGSRGSNSLAARRRPRPPGVGSSSPEIAGWGPPSSRRSLRPVRVAERGSLESLEARSRGARGSTTDRCAAIDRAAPPRMPRRRISRSACCRRCSAGVATGAATLVRDSRRAGVAMTRRSRRVAVEQAALWGTGRVVAEEHPELWGGLVDLDPGAAAGDARQLGAHSCSRPTAKIRLRSAMASGFVLRLDTAIAAMPHGRHSPGARTRPT